MRAIIKYGKELLFLEGESGKNYLDLKDKLIVNFMDKWIYEGYTFKRRDGSRLTINTSQGSILIVFSSLVKDVKLEQYEKNQLIFKLIKL